MGNIPGRELIFTLVSLELEALRRSIGPLGWRLLAPLLRTSTRELWQLHMLRERSGG